MREVRTEFRLSHNEKEELGKICRKYGLTFGDYIRRKLFDENEDFINASERHNNEIYISPDSNKNNLITITILYKIYYLITQILEKQPLSNEEITDTEQQSLEYAREQRARYGYRLIKADEQLLDEWFGISGDTEWAIWDEASKMSNLKCSNVGWVI